MPHHLDSDSLLQAIYSSTHDYGIITIDLDGRITTWNSGAERILGFSSAEAIGQDQSIIYTMEDRIRDEPRLAMEIANTTGRAEDYRWHLRKDGSRFWADGVLTLLHDAPGKRIGYLKILQDITEQKIHETEMYRLANSDMLTGLANRYAFEMRAAELIAVAVRSRQPVALLLIDLDRFKQVNDGLGHQAGDTLLKQAAHRMRDALRDSDFLARLGGDEFAVLQPNMSAPYAAGELATKLNKILSQPFAIDGHSLQVSGSVGIAICPTDADDLDRLMKKADLAMYRAKLEGKGTFRYFSNTFDAAAHKKSQDLSLIRQAVHKKEFWLEYQPKVAFATGRTLGVEALLRCANPSFASYSTEGMIELAIEAGMMKTLSLWVLEEACAQLRGWMESGFGDLRVCVNLCADDLTDPDMPHIVDAIIANNALKHSNLEIEITERQALDVEARGISTLHALRARGIQIALDDFGTGYSALSYLKNLPVTSVKLDKSFLVGVPGDPQGSAVVRAVMDLSHALGLEIIAEGVETDEQAAYLKAYQCTALQGFLIARPLSAQDMTAWLSGVSRAVH